MCAWSKIRRLLPAIAVVLQFAVLPCVMAMPVEAADDCEHCDGAARQSHCMVASDESVADTGINSRDRLGAAPPSADAFSLAPLPVVPQALDFTGSAATRIGRHTGRHSGDPPLNLLYGNFRI